MPEFINGKFELRAWTVLLLFVVTLALGVTGDQATFVHAPRNGWERLLTLLPVLVYKLSGDRTICLVMVMGLYGGLLGGAGFAVVGLLERHVFEPMYFKRMIRTKLREEKLFNHYMHGDKS